jgi:crotonobetainyl-CoA:carnitine CoA-transferase CaiB-like acyl-CoA transferase
VACSPSGVFRCEDGFIGMAAVSDVQFRGLCMAMGRQELARDPRFATLAARLEDQHNRELHGIIAAWAITRKAQNLEELADQHEFSAQRVSNSRDHYHDEHLRQRGAVCEFDDPLYGRVVEYGPGPKLSESPGRMRWIAKPVGFHNDYVFKNLLGLSSDEIEELTAKSVVGAWDDRIGAKPPDDWNGRDGVVS